MAETAVIKFRTEPNLKEEVENILKRLGITSTEAINLFYHQIKLRKGLPFDVKIPNRKTLKTFKKTDANQELNSYETIDEFLTKMENHD